MYLILGMSLSAAVGRQLAWRCLTKCNILSSNTLVADELSGIRLTDLFAAYDVDGLQAAIF